MIRGVNKKVIEISDTGNDSFERAILFVRPSRSGGADDELRTRATEYLSGLRLRRKLLQGSLWKKLVLFTGASLLGAAVTALVLLL